VPVSTQDGTASCSRASLLVAAPARARLRLTRRQLLIIGGGLMDIVAAGTLYRAADHGVFSVGQGPAFEPWHSWRADGDADPQALVGAAILAANGHNVQPWRFRVGQDHLDLFGDPRRRTGAMDPIDRELWIGLGCALENLVLAARAAAYSGERSRAGLEELFRSFAEFTQPPDPQTMTRMASTYHCDLDFDSTFPIVQRHRLLF
jgi:hypothetical protein